MKIVFASNFLNHHQAPVCDELYKLTGENFHFIETTQVPEDRKKMGYKNFHTKPYAIQAWKNENDRNFAIEICNNADVILFTPSTVEYAIKAIKDGKICFEIAERWLKRGYINLLSPLLLKCLWHYHTLFYKKRVFRLCSSAFAAMDEYKMQAYKNRCYKWGYFTKVDKIEIESIVRQKNTGEIKIMWCARFIDWKHPKLPIMLASRLKDAGYKFHINMFGDGERCVEMQQLSAKLGVTEHITFNGNKQNEEILSSMREHDIFLFTSDKNEGWGAVANEAMGNGCVLVASDEIGSIPFLINEGENGCIFKSKDIDSLTGKVEYLINNPKEREKMAINAYKTMRDTWSPQNAAKSLLQLIEDIENKREISIIDGPCSKALPQKEAI